MNFSILIVFLLASTLSAKLTEDQQVCENNANRGRVLRKETTKMNLLEYDEKLEEAAKKEKHSCPLYNVEEIKKDEMYSTSSYSQLMGHPYATKVACITVYCENKKTNSTVYVVDKGPTKAIDSCPSGRTVDAQTGLCVASSASSGAFIGLSLIFSINFI
ncbi:unnamed protein product [Caenorhabditis brenneri]